MLSQRNLRTGEKMAQKKTKKPVAAKSPKVTKGTKKAAAPKVAKPKTKKK